MTKNGAKNCTQKILITEMCVFDSCGYQLPCRNLESPNIYTTLLTIFLCNWKYIRTGENVNCYIQRKNKWNCRNLWRNTKMSSTSEEQEVKEKSTILTLETLYLFDNGKICYHQTFQKSMFFAGNYVEEKRQISRFLRRLPTIE